jgi:hypothetical protein
MMHVGTSARRHDQSCRRAVVPTCIALALACGGSRVPHALRGYNILVEQNDPQSVELARAMREQGIKVRPRVRGGSGPTAALIYFTFSDPGPGQPLWFHIRLADTRSGEIVGTATIPLDSLTTTPRARALAAVKALAP